MTESEHGHQGSYERGVEQGRVVERLGGHDDHFIRINGSIDKSTERLTSLETTMDRMVNLITNFPIKFSEQPSVQEEDSKRSKFLNREPSRTILALQVTMIVLLLILIYVEVT